MSIINQNLSLEMQEKYLKVIEGRELNIRLANEISSPDNLFYPAFLQGMTALREIVLQTRTFYQEGNAECLLKGFDNDSLSLYNGNIIAFEAQRGYGKTQTMLSFSHYLKRISGVYKQDCEYWKCGARRNTYVEDKKELSIFRESADNSTTCIPRFIVLPMIAPSALEEKQKLLHVILSRLYSYASEQAKDLNDDERINLSCILQKCLSGINGFKKLEENNTYDDFSSLQDVSDGLALRKHFWELLHFLSIKPERGGTAPENTFFVIQLDDVDSQIKYGYQVLDDIRKYLIIPNLVILISTDEDLLFRSIQEEHLQQFKSLKEIDPLYMPSIVAKISKKYINKLIPPSHMIHLPRLEHYMENSKVRLKLYYLKKDISDIDFKRYFLENREHEISENELLVLPWQQASVGFDIQETLFQLIFRKTGIVFSMHSNYMHNIIPRSLRGLCQLLFFLKGMEDIPVFTEKDFESEYAYISAWENRIRITELNLSYFKNYFINEWLDVKATRSSKDRNDRQFLRDLLDAPETDRVFLSIEYLSRCFPQSTDLQETLINLQDRKREAENELNKLPMNTSVTSKIKKKQDLQETINKINAELSTLNDSTPPNTIMGLNQYMLELSKTHRKSEDYLLLFSIHVLLSIASHMMILQEMKRSISMYLLNCENELSKRGFTNYFAFTLDPKNMSMPRTFPAQHERHIYLEINDLKIPVTTSISQEEAKTLWKNIDKIYKNLANLSFYRSIFNCFTVSEKNTNPIRLNILCFPTILLNLGKTLNPLAMETIDRQKTEAENMSDSMGLSKKFQKRLYYMQELPTFILSNWDVQEKIYKYLETRLGSLRNDNPDYAGSLSKLADNTKGNNYTELCELQLGEDDFVDLSEYLFSGIDTFLRNEYKLQMSYLFQVFPKDENGVPNVGLADAFIHCMYDDGQLFSNADFSHFLWSIFMKKGIL